MPKILLVTAQGTDGMEVHALLDYCGRIKPNVDVTIAALHTNQSFRGYRDLIIRAKKKLSEVVNDTYDAVIIPGGYDASDRLAKAGEVRSILKNHQKNNKLIGAMDTSIKVLTSHGVREERSPSKATGMTGESAMMGGERKDKSAEEVVTLDGKILTGDHPRDIETFVYRLLEELCGEKEVLKMFQS